MTDNGRRGPRPSLREEEKDQSHLGADERATDLRGVSRQRRRASTHGSAATGPQARHGVGHMSPSGQVAAPNRNLRWVTRAGNLTSAGQRQAKADVSVSAQVSSSGSASRSRRLVAASDRHLCLGRLVGHSAERRSPTGQESASGMPLHCRCPDDPVCLAAFANRPPQLVNNLHHAAARGPPPALAACCTCGEPRCHAEWHDQAGNVKRAIAHVFMFAA